LPQRGNISRVRSHDEIEIQPYQLGGVRGRELVRLTARLAVFDRDVLAFYVAKLAQPWLVRIKMVTLTMVSSAPSASLFF
jgi:hypothetical protein